MTVGAIEGISWREATASKPAEMRLLLRGRVAHAKDGRADPNYITGTDKIGSLVAAINAVVQAAQPVTNRDKKLDLTKKVPQQGHRADKPLTGPMKDLNPAIKNAIQAALLPDETVRASSEGECLERCGRRKGRRRGCYS